MYVCCLETKECTDEIFNRIGKYKKLTSEVAHKYTGENSCTSSSAYDPKTRSPGTLEVKRSIILQ